MIQKFVKNVKKALLLLKANVSVALETVGLVQWMLLNQNAMNVYQVSS